MRSLPAQFLVTASLLFLAACGEARNPGSEPTDSSAALPVEAGAGDDAAGMGGANIPAKLQGRWGMVAADCTSDRGDAKGLLVIDGTTLKFYESVGTLAEVHERDANRIVATFAFTGEGMAWTRDETLALDGGALTRTADDAEGPFTYQRCA